MREKFNTVQQLAVDAASEKKAFDILILDLRNRSDLTDSFMICSANSKVQAQSIVVPNFFELRLEFLRMIDIAFQSVQVPLTLTSPYLFIEL